AGFRVRLHALGDVDHRRHHEETLRRANWIEADFDRHFVPVLAEAEQFQAHTHRTRPKIVREARAMRGVLTAETLRNERLEGLADHLRRPVTKHLLDLSIGQYDPAVLADHHQGIGRRFEDLPEPLFGPNPVGDVYA